MTSYPIKSVIFVLLATFLWATTGPIVRWLALPALWICAVRFIVPAVLSTFLVLVRRERIDPSRTEVISSLLNAVRTILFVMALSYTTVTGALPVLFSWPIFSMIYGRFLLNEAFTRQGIVGTFCCFLGVTAVFSQAINLAGDHLIGVALMLTSAMIYGLVNVLNKSSLSDKTPFEVVFSQNLLGALCFLPALYVYPIPEDPVQLVGAIYYGLTAGAAGFLLYFTALRILPTTVAATLCYCELLFSFILSTLFLSEKLSISTTVGAILIVMGAWYVRRPTVATHA